MGRSKQGKTTSLYFYARSQIEKLGKKILAEYTESVVC